MLRVREKVSRCLPQPALMVWSETETLTIGGFDAGTVPMVRLV